MVSSHSLLTWCFRSFFLHSQEAAEKAAAKEAKAKEAAAKKEEAAKAKAEVREIVCFG